MASAPELVRIPAGDFQMGAGNGEEDERPVHRVFVSEFLIGRFPVTNDEYARFVRATGYPSPAVREIPLVAAGDRDASFRELAAPYAWEGAVPPSGRGNHPVVLIRYDDALSYCEWLSDNLGRRVRLPTEAEWEKAARGGVAGRTYPWGEEIDASRGNYLNNAAVKHERGTTAIGGYQPNEYGLHDMGGNVWEWVADWYAPDYYGAADNSDPHGPPTGTLRIVRGGSWVNEEASMLRCSYRHKVPPDTYAYSIGFRIVCAL